MKAYRKKIALTLLSSCNDHVEFTVENAGTIRRVTVANSIKLGNMFTIYYGDGHYVPFQKEASRWLGENGDLKSDLIKSILKSCVYIGENTDSQHFYKLIAKKFCLCHCHEPYLKRQNTPLSHRLLALDLEHAKYGRSMSRNIIYLGVCGRCSKALTYGTGIGSFCTTGEDNLKSLAEKEVGETINFDKIITAISQLT
jgi:hypothetical protein